VSDEDNEEDEDDDGYRKAAILMIRMNAGTVAPYLGSVQVM
jgi:hypothetical protein